MDSTGNTMADTQPRIVLVVDAQKLIGHINGGLDDVLSRSLNKELAKVKTESAGR